MNQNTINQIKKQNKQKNSTHIHQNIINNENINSIKISIAILICSEYYQKTQRTSKNQHLIKQIIELRSQNNRKQCPKGSQKLQKNNFIIQSILGLMQFIQSIQWLKRIDGIVLSEIQMNTSKAAITLENFLNQQKKICSFLVKLISKRVGKQIRNQKEQILWFQIWIKHWFIIKRQLNLKQIVSQKRRRIDHLQKNLLKHYQNNMKQLFSQQLYQIIQILQKIQLIKMKQFNKDCIEIKLFLRLMFISRIFQNQIKIYRNLQQQITCLKILNCNQRMKFTFKLVWRCERQSNQRSYIIA
ncbi:unnamed protein product [Paramecium sonneborni]|uniref:Uncharacterized protein n=1 Tax=Paramecium sonneborni TaxID=65129 RepID=A0A8S1PAJ9_9CILI|nr:unnamed protein product [Paramecium sonneborni]